MRAYVHVYMLNCVQLYDLMDCSPPVSFIYGIFQAKILEWVTISFSRRSFDSGIEPMSLGSPELAGGFFAS